MNFTQSFKLALKSLKTSKMRAFLTMLGIIIGVGAVIVILSLGNGMTNMMNSQFEKMGSNLIQVMTYGRGTGGTRDVDVEDLYELVDKYPQYLTGVTPYVSASAKVRYQTDDYDRTSVYGVSEAFFKEDTKGTMQGETLAEGRFLSYIDVDRHQNVCVIGDYLAQTAFRGDALGKTISLSGVPYTVIGVLSKSGDSSEGSADDVIYIPYENAQRMGTGTMMMGTDEMFLLTSTSRDTASAAKGIVEKRLYKTYQSSDYYMVMTSAEMMDAMDSMLNTLMMILILYRLTTPRRPQHRVLPGAVFSAVAIVCMSILLSWLIGRSTKYSLVYGSLASVVILLFWFQAFGLLLILGVLLNHALEVTAEQEP